MEDSKKKVEKRKMPEKMSYEQLDNIAHQLSEQNRELYKQLQQANYSNIFKRLDYLFMVAKHPNIFIETGHKQFVENSVNEIVNILTIKEAEPADTKEAK